MRKGVWVCNIPPEDYEKLSDSIYSTFVIGPPCLKKNENNNNLVGLYTTENTPLDLYEFLSVGKPKRKRKKVKEEVIETIDETERPEMKKENDDEDEINLLDLIDE